MAEFIFAETSPLTQWSSVYQCAERCHSSWRRGTTMWALQWCRHWDQWHPSTGNSKFSTGASPSSRKDLKRNGMIPWKTWAMQDTRATLSFWGQLTFTHNTLSNCKQLLFHCTIFEMRTSWSNTSSVWYVFYTVPCVVILFGWLLPKSLQGCWHRCEAFSCLFTNQVRAWAISWV